MPWGFAVQWRYERDQTFFDVQVRRDGCRWSISRLDLLVDAVNLTLDSHIRATMMRVMRTPEATIIEHITHPLEIVRRMALDYFAEMYSRDEAVTRTVIRAMDQYKQSKDFWFHCASNLDNLTHDDETLPWVIANYDKLQYPGNHYTVDHGARIFDAADIRLVEKHFSAISASRAIPRKEIRAIENRVELHETGSEACWERLCRHCKKYGDEMDSRNVNIPYMQRLVEVCATEREIMKPIVLDFLGKDYDNDALAESPFIGWLEPMVVDLSGRMRIQNAVPHLARRLSSDGDFVREASVTALAKINDAETVALIVEAYALLEGDNLFMVAEALDHIRSDKTAQALIDLMHQAEPEIATWMASGAVEQLDTVALEPVSDMVRHDDYDISFCDLKDHVVAAATIMGATFPEYDQWIKEVTDPAYDQRVRERIKRKRGVSPPIQFPPASPGTVWTKTGPNEPCPCGSGKKFKKCCMRAGN